MTRILVVDNNPMVLEFMKEVLSGNSRSVETVESGLEALDSIRRTVPDIIFVDLVMPQIDGKQLCRLFRANERTRESFIVIISAIAAEERNFDYTELADAYLAKIPFKIMKDYLLALVEDVERGNTAHYKDGIVGLDHIYNRDITKELLFTKHHMEVLLSSITDGFVELSNSCRVIFANDAALQLFDTPRDELITSYLPQLFPRETGDRIEAILDTMNGDEHILGEQEDVTLRDRYLRLKFNTVRYGEFRSVILIIQDITEQKEAERIIRDDLQKKETLLKEVHHRVKNNLNVIASLLSLQTSFIDDETIRKHLTDSKSRVESMALIHEKLYNTEDLSGIYLDTYLEDLSAHLIDTYNRSQLPVRSYISIPSFHISLAAAVPLGLIINELITNSLEHGLSTDIEGKIELSFQETDTQYCLIVRDNGKGLPEDFDPAASESLGLLLVQNLCSQIDAVFTLESDNGTVATLCFQKTGNVLME